MQLDLTDTVASEIRAEMARQRVTQRQLGEALGIHQTQVARRLRGDIAFNTVELEKTAEFLRVPITRLLGDGTGPTGPTPTGPGPTGPTQPPAPGRAA